ncbi:MAG: right-handed parallel beta-helix repeat-containing protein [Bacteroidales bacterium]|nr:right-handed parallel beta-helix repeat-containing protein [Bacteroidales bacterium]
MKHSINILCLLILIQIKVLSAIIIVDINGGGNYLSIQEGINNANSGDTVLVYPGTYFEIIDFIGKDIIVGSLYLTTSDTSYISQTIIDGNNENFRLVRFTNNETQLAKFTGFTVTHANLSWKNSNPYSTGLAIYINGSSPVIEHNIMIDNNFGSWYGNGGTIVLENSAAIICDNLISDSYGAFDGGGIYIIESHNVKIQNNIISDHRLLSGYGVAHGAGLYINTSHDLYIEGNIIKNNYNDYGYGGGIYIIGSTNIIIENNQIINNITCGDGGTVTITNSSGVFLINNLIANNFVYWIGGGISGYNSNFLIVNNTICNNVTDTSYSYGHGGGIYLENASPQIYNSIIYGNSALLSGNQIYLKTDNTDPDFYYCDIQGGLEGFGMDTNFTYNGIYENNIDEYPIFLYTGEHPYSIDNYSPCINSGQPDTSGLYITEFDLAGNLRIVNDTIDIGAYEHQFVSNIKDKNALKDDFCIFPNPAKGKFNILFNKFNKNKYEVMITDISGKVVKSMNIKNHLTQVDITDFPKGIYFIKVKSKNFIRFKRIIIN